jgi:hypothetical protein
VKVYPLVIESARVRNPKVLLLFGGLSLQPSRRQPHFTSALRAVSCISLHMIQAVFPKSALMI